MIDAFVSAWDSRKDEVEAAFRANFPSNYDDIVKAVIDILPEYDFDRFHRIDVGDYQGTIIYLVPANTYLPSTYLFIRVSYGSCSGSGCGTLESIRDDYRYSDDGDLQTTTDGQIKDLMALALHVVQSTKIL